MRTYLSNPPVSSPWFRAVVLVVSAASLAVGCAPRPPRISAIDIDIPGVCSQLFTDYDKDQDGLLSEKELASVPPINASFRDMDKDKDGHVSKGELQARIERVFNPKVGMISATCRVTNKGRPIPNATVFFVPVKDMQLDPENVPIASGLTSSQGVAEMEIHPDYLPPGAPKVRGLVRPGFYLVEVTTAQGTIPPKYNTETTLGVEVSPDTAVGGPIKIDLQY